LNWLTIYNIFKINENKNNASIYAVKGTVCKGIMGKKLAKKIIAYIKA